MTGEPVHTASKERMVSEVLFLTERIPQLSITELKVNWPLCFTMFSTHYKQIAVEAPLQSIQSPWKIQTIPIYKCREAIV